MDVKDLNTYRVLAYAPRVLAFGQSLLAYETPIQVWHTAKRVLSYGTYLDTGVLVHLDIQHVRHLMQEVRPMGADRLVYGRESAAADGSLRQLQNPLACTIWAVAKEPSSTPSATTSLQPDSSSPSHEPISCAESQHKTVCVRECVCA